MNGVYYVDKENGKGVSKHDNQCFRVNKKHSNFHAITFVKNVGGSTFLSRCHSNVLKTRITFVVLPVFNLLFLGNNSCDVDNPNCQSKSSQIQI